jgi:hypothetical protein
MPIKKPDYVCPPDHKHELTQVCHSHHKCRCEWCVSEARARYQEKTGRNGQWTAKELIVEIEHFVNLGYSALTAVQEMNVNPTTAKTVLYRNDRPDLARQLKA